MRQHTVRHIFEFREALQHLAVGGPFATLEAWRRLVVGSLNRAGRRTCHDDDLVGDVVGAIWVRLLDIRRRSSTQWTNLLALEEGPLRATLGRMAVNAVLDQDPQRRPLRALAQVVAGVLGEGVPVVAAPPSSLTSGERFCRDSVAHAVAWAKVQADAPAHAPYPLARYLMAHYGLGRSIPVDDTLEPASSAPSPSDLAERRDHARTVLATLQLRLAPDEASALGLHLEGATLQDIAQDLGCKRTKAHGLATRARREAATVVEALEEEWRVL